MLTGASEILATKLADVNIVLPMEVDDGWVDV